MWDPLVGVTHERRPQFLVRLLLSPPHAAPLATLQTPFRATRRRCVRSIAAVPAAGGVSAAAVKQAPAPAPAGCSTKCPRGETAEGSVRPVPGGRRGIESLPDGVLEHILGFLPSPEAVRTCVLARRWRHLWKSATGLRVGCCNPDEPVSVEGLRSFVNHLLLLRGGAPLDTCHLTFDALLSSHDDVAHVNLWFRHIVVMCSVRVLSLFLFGHRSSEPWLELDNLALISHRLRRLELAGVWVHNNLLDFSGCPALEHLELDYCELSSVKEIVSESLKHLSIFDSVCSSDSRIRICTPSLVWLRLEYLKKRTPLLERMPSLLEATVRITMGCSDHCTNASYETCDCESCDSSDSMPNTNENGVLLKGLSEAKSLALISRSGMFIFKRDLRWCPIFTRLKTLLLNDYWCVPNDFLALACILEHSPVLEKLTLQLCKQWLKHKVEMTLQVIPTKRPAALSEHLKTVKVNCETVDDRVLKVMKFLCAFKCFSLDEVEILEK